MKSHLALTMSNLWRNNSLIYFETGNSFFFDLDETLGEMQTILSLQRYLLRNAKIEIIRIFQDEHYSNDSQDNSELRIAIKGLFWAPTDPSNQLVSEEFVGALDQLTFAGQKVREINFETALELYLNEHLSKNLNQDELDVVNESIKEKGIIPFDIEHDWNRKSLKLKIESEIASRNIDNVSIFMKGLGFDDDESKVFSLHPDNLGLYSWLFGVVEKNVFPDNLFLNVQCSSPPRRLFTNSFHRTDIQYPKKDKSL